MKFATKPIQHTHLTYTTLKNEKLIFCRHSADMTENGQDFDKNFVFEGVHSKEVDR